MLSHTNMDLLIEMLPFWEKLSLSEREQVFSNTTLVRYRQGETVHCADAKCTGVLAVKSGELRTYILSEEGKEITLYRPGKKEVCILSASCVLSNITFDVHIDAQRDTEVLLIHFGLFSKLMEQNVYVENFALRIAAERFSDVMWAMEQILFMSFDRRLAIFLLDEAAGTGTDILAFTHEQIARYIGSAREVVSRMLKYFSDEGIVSLHRGSVCIHDKERLRKLSGL